MRPHILDSFQRDVLVNLSLKQMKFLTFPYIPIHIVTISHKFGFTYVTSCLGRSVYLKSTHVIIDLILVKNQCTKPLNNPNGGGCL